MPTMLVMRLQGNFCLVWGVKRLEHGGMVQRICVSITLQEEVGRGYGLMTRDRTEYDARRHVWYGERHRASNRAWHESHKEEIGAKAERQRREAITVLGGTC